MGRVYYQRKQLGGWKVYRRFLIFKKADKKYIRGNNTVRKKASRMIGAFFNKPYIIKRRQEKKYREINNNYCYLRIDVI